MERNYLPYNDTTKLFVQEGDIFLYRPSSLCGKIIQKFSRGAYSHAGLASWHNSHNILETIEFLWYGCTTKIFDRVIEKQSGYIDVYRPVSSHVVINFDPITHHTSSSIKSFKPKSITNDMRKLTGLPYGWSRIWKFAKSYLLGFRLFYNVQDIIDDTPTDKMHYVCSTSIAHVFSKNNFDLMPNKSDRWIKPSDLSNSSLLNYLFTFTTN